MKKILSLIFALTISMGSWAQESTTEMPDARLQEFAEKCLKESKTWMGYPGVVSQKSEQIMASRRH